MRDLLALGLLFLAFAGAFMLGFLLPLLLSGEQSW